MSFGLLAPLALLLGALLVGPLLAHLARQRPDRDRTYGAMLLLQRLDRKLRRQRRVRDVLLLVLRLAALLLFVAAASRPEVRWPGGAPAVGGTSVVVVIIDNSLSMDLEGGVAGGSPNAGAGTLLAVARERAGALVRALPAGTRLGLVTAGGEAERVTPKLHRDPSRMAADIAAIAQTQEGTDLSGALRLARQLLEGAGGEVVVYTDEAGPTAVDAARDEIRLLGEQGAALIPMPVLAERPGNVAVTAATYGSGPEGGSVEVVVQSYSDRAVEVPVVVELPDGTQITAFAKVPREASTTVSVTVPRVTDGGVGIARVLPRGISNVAGDDAYAFQLPRVGASRVLVVDGDPGLTPVASEVYFLERALAPWGAMDSATGVLPDVTSAAGVADLDPETHRVVFLANVPDPGPLSARLRDFVLRGGGVVIALGDNVTAERYNGALQGLLPAALRRTRAVADPGTPGVATALPDTGLLLFKPFSRGGRSAFGRARWHTVTTLEPYVEAPENGDVLPDGGVRTLLRLDGGLPLLVERSVGRGRVLLFTSTLDLGWGDLPLQAIFMPLVQRLVTYLGGDAGGGGERRVGQVGEPVRLPLPDVALDVVVRGPSGPVAAHVDGGVLTFTPDAAGAYLIEAPGAPPLAWVAANVDPRESDVRRGPSLVKTAAEVDPARYLRHLGLGPYLLLAAGLLVLISTLYAAWLGRVPQREPGDAELSDAA